MLSELPVLIMPIQQKAIRGDPDFILCVLGVMVGLELKAMEKSKVAKLQIFKLMQIERYGGIGLIAYPGNWDKVLAYIKELTIAQGKEKPRCLRLPTSSCGIEVL